MKEQETTYSYEDKDFFSLFPKRVEESHKGTYGKVGVIAGSKGMAGAAFLCARAAYMVGAGLVQIYTHEENRIVLQQLLPEAIVVTYTGFDEAQLAEFLNTSDIIAIGCGLGQNAVSLQILQYTMRNATCPCVVDADGLNLVAKDISLLGEVVQPMILTPHMKEMSRLLCCTVEELKEHRIFRLSEFTERYNVTCVLKDARTLVSTGGRQIYKNTTGNCAMAKGGSGDVLTGIISGIVGQKVNIHDAACLGVYLHGKAGDVARDKLGYYSVMARDIIDAVSEVLK